MCVAVSSDKCQEVCLKAGMCDAPVQDLKKLHTACKAHVQLEECCQIWLKARPL